MNKIPCKEIKEKVLLNNKKIINSMERKPKLVTLLCENSASNVYVKNKEKAIDFVEAEYETIKIDKNIKLEEFKNIIINLAKDGLVDAILVQLPLYEHLEPYKDEILNLIPFNKDIDGFVKENINKEKDYIVPCTVLGILEIFKYYNYDLTGKSVLVIGRGPTCAKPLIKELNNKNATILWANSKTNKELLKKLINISDVVVSAVGNKSFLIDESYFEKDKKLDFIIDVGIVREEKGIRGDFDFSSYKYTDYYTTTPGGTGQLTVAFLSSNLINCYNLDKKEIDYSKVSDGYHTFEELYDFRLDYNALLFNEWYAQGKYNVSKSKRHNDGELCFGGNWFIVTAELPTGQISNHYEISKWDLFKVKETEKSELVFDGHTPLDVLERMEKLISLKGDLK